MALTSSDATSPWPVVLSHLADLELAGVQQFRHFLDEAPTLEDRWQLMQCQKDQMGAARGLLKLARATGLSAQQEHDLMFRALGDHAFEGARRRLQEWEEAAAQLVVMSEAQISLLRLLSKRGDEALDKFAASSIIEKEVHVRFGLLVLRRRAQQTDLARTQRLLAAAAPVSLEAFDGITAAAGALLPPADRSAARMALQQRLEQAAAALRPHVDTPRRPAHPEEPTGAYG